MQRNGFHLVLRVCLLGQRGRDFTAPIRPEVEANHHIVWCDANGVADDEGPDEFIGNVLGIVRFDAIGRCRVSGALPTYERGDTACPIRSQRLSRSIA